MWRPCCRAPPQGCLLGQPGPAEPTLQPEQVPAKERHVPGKEAKPDEERRVEGEDPKQAKEQTQEQKQLPGEEETG